MRPLEFAFVATLALALSAQARITLVGDRPNGAGVGIRTGRKSGCNRTAVAVWLRRPIRRMRLNRLQQNQPQSSKNRASGMARLAKMVFITT
jgi:hypothetical protein